jgi:hypothetical protein
MTPRNGVLAKGLATRGQVNSWHVTGVTAYSLLRQRARCDHSFFIATTALPMNLPDSRRPDQIQLSEIYASLHHPQPVVVCGLSNNLV